MIILVSDLVGGTDVRAVDDLFHLLEDFASCTHDGGKGGLELLDKWGIVVAYLLYDEGKDVPGVVEGDSVV